MAMELIERVPMGFIWQDGNQRRLETVAGTILNYDAGNIMESVDMTPRRVVSPALDGWRIVQNGWHYALGKDLANHGQEDGWVGFGGRSGAHWFKFRLIRGGYFHIQPGTPLLVDAFTDLGGAPTYDRLKLSTVTESLTLGPDGAPVSVNVLTKVVWSDIFPGVALQWRVEGRKLKEEIILSQATREALPNPTTPPANTWFGWVFKIDVADIPQWVLDGQAASTEDMLIDTGELHLQDALGRLLAFMPLDYAFSDPDADGERQQVLLRKRLWHDGDGNHYLLVGAPVLELAALPAGAITFDPTLDTGATGDNTLDSSAPTVNRGTSVQIKMWATKFHTLIIFDMSSIGASDTCDSSDMTLTCVEAKSARTYNGYKMLQTWGETTSTWNTYDGTSSWPGSAGASTAGTDYNATSIGSITHPESSENTAATASLDTTQTEAEFGGNLDMMFGIDGAGSNLSRKWHSSEAETASYRPQLVVVYTVASTGGAIMTANKGFW